MSQLQTEVMWDGNDNVLRVIGLSNAVTGAYLNDLATVEVTLTDSDGNEVTGQSWPLGVTYVAASDGEYRAILPQALSITPGATYTATVDADGGAGLKGRWEIPVLCRTRTY